MDQRPRGFLAHAAGQRCHPAVAGCRPAVIETGKGGQPVFKLIEETAHGLTKLKIEKAEDQRPSKTEKRR